MLRTNLENSSAPDAICIHGAREHNLKNLSVAIPRGKFVVVTGVSGSGKSTLAFDLIFAEGQRRFLDSMNTYARQFVEQMSRPDVDLITGIPPTVSIEQRNSRADGKIYSTGDKLRLDRFREHDVEIVVGVLEAKRRRVGRGVLTAPPSRMKPERRAGDSAPYQPKPPQQLIDEALNLGHGTLFALDNHGALTVHSTERSCPGCGRSFEPLDPKNFSYNSSQGWCQKCRGFGELFYLPEDVDRGARADAIEESWWSWQEGERELCPECKGMRLNPIPRAVRLNVGQASRLSSEFMRSSDGRNKAKDRRDTCPTIDAFNRASVKEVFRFFHRLRFKGREAQIARDILPEIRERLRFLHEVGLGYLQLGRGVPTLSGGEAQRIRLAAQLGSNLSGVLYVLDEPTIGLHARDNELLLATLAVLKSRGNSLVVVEHDDGTMRHADFIV